MPALETFKNVPELFEGVSEESIKARTDSINTFKQLGPDDLVHVVKNIPNSRQHIKEVSSYHFITGVDTSSSASIAAYINTLTYSLSSQQKWSLSIRSNPSSSSSNPSVLSGNSWSISKCTFCAYNAFSGMDVRVEARIPGGVKSYNVDVLGIRKGTDPEGWQETFLSSILRTLKCAEIFPDLLFEDYSEFKVKRFIDGQLSLQTEMKFLESATKLFSRGRQLGSPFGPHLAGNHDNFLTLGVVGYFCGTGRPEIAIGFLKGFSENDTSLNGLLMKCFLLSNNQQLAVKMMSDSSAFYPQIADFLISRDEIEKADHFASESLKNSPNDFSNWRRLIKIKISLGQIEKALIILNNSPMTSLQEGHGDFYKNLPKPVLISLPGTGGLSGNSSEGGHQSILEKLKAPGLKGNYKEAYEVLIEIYKKIGWDELLEFRSKVFIMEKELLEEKEIRRDLSGLTISASASDSDSKDDAVLKSPLSEPVHFLSLPDKQFLSKTDKKLCERWLDNLILILFEDLRIFSLFTEELKLQKSHHHSLKDWFLLGKLSKRLSHLEEAKFSYQKCLFTNCKHFDELLFVNLALIDLIEIYCKEGKVQLSLLCILRLLNSQSTLYTSLLHPTRVSLNLCGLIEGVGLNRVQSELRIISLQQKDQEIPTDGMKKLDDFLQFVKNAKIHGYNY